MLDTVLSILYVRFVTTLTATGTRLVEQLSILYVRFMRILEKRAKLGSLLSILYVRFEKQTTILNDQHSLLFQFSM